MLAHLDLLTIKAISYSWVSVCAFHKFITKQAEQRRLDSQDFKSIQYQATTLLRHSDLQSSRQRTAEGARLSSNTASSGNHSQAVTPSFPRLVELEIMSAFATVISKMLMLIRNIIDAECARLIILCYTVLNVICQFPGNDSYSTMPLTLRPLWPRTGTDMNLSTLQLSYDM